MPDALARRHVHADERAYRAVELACRHQIGCARQQLRQVRLDGLVLDQHAGDALAELTQRGGKAELGAQAIAVGADMAADDEVVERAHGSRQLL